MVRSNERQRKVWVLDTATKGTGAQMVPIDKVENPEAQGRSVIVVRERKHPAPAPSEPREPHRFKVVDVMTRQALGKDLGTADTVELLRGVRSVVDVSIFVWDGERDDWRELTLADRKAVSALRDRG